MASKRMLSDKVIKSDAFISMPLSAQALYMHINLECDDDGFCNRAKSIQRSIGASDDDLLLLISKKFLIAFDDGVVLVKHWWIHNYIRRDRYHKTTYTEHIKQVVIDDNDGYKMATKCLPLGDRDKNRIDKIRLEEIRIDKNSQAVSFLTDEQLEYILNIYPFGKVIVRAKALQDKTYDNLIKELERR